MTEEIMTELKEGDKAFPDKENENSSESSTDKTNINQTQSSNEDKDKTEKKDDNANLADHPRWKEREEDWTKRFNEQEKRHLDELTKFREEIEGKLSQQNQSKLPIDIPEWFGGNEQQWVKYKEHEDSRINAALSKATEAILKDITNKQTSEQKAIDEATEYFNEQVLSIESEYKETVDRNKLLKFVLDNDLVDSKGRWNYKIGYKLMKTEIDNSKNDAINEKKKVANATTSENKAENKSPNYTTSEDFKKQGARPW